MPIYEFRCNQCGRVSSVFQRNITANVNAVCAHCGSPDLSRLISSFAFMRADVITDDALSDLGDIDENDPRSVARWVRRMKSEGYGEDLGPEFDNMVERMEAGESIEDIEGAEAETNGDEGFD